MFSLSPSPSAHAQVASSTFPACGETSPSIQTTNGTLVLGLYLKFVEESCNPDANDTFTVQFIIECQQNYE